MTDQKDAPERLARLMDSLADHAELMSDEAVLADAKATGIDADVEANRIRDLLLSAVVRARKERLTEAFEAHRKTVALLASRTARLPAAPADRRAMLMRALEKRPQVKEALVTLQHRDFALFSDGDVESVLKQLDELGLLEKDDSEPKP